MSMLDLRRAAPLAPVLSVVAAFSLILPARWARWLQPAKKNAPCANGFRLAGGAGRAAAWHKSQMLLLGAALRRAGARR